MARTDLALDMLNNIGILDTERVSLYITRDLCTFQRARSWDPHVKYIWYLAVGTEHLGPADLLRHGPNTLAPPLDSNTPRARLGVVESTSNLSEHCYSMTREGIDEHAVKENGYESRAWQFAGRWVDWRAVPY